MKITRSFFIDEWVGVNSDLTAEFILECLIHFCRTHDDGSWINLFADSKERNEIVERYFDLGGFVLGAKSGDVSNLSKQRVGEVFDRTSPEFPFILAIMVKIFGCLKKAEDIEVKFGAFLPYLDNLFLTNPRWKDELAMSVLQPKQFTESEIKSIDFVKRGLVYLETAISKSPNLIPQEIKNAANIIQSNLRAFNN